MSFEMFKNDMILKIGAIAQLVSTCMACRGSAVDPWLHMINNTIKFNFEFLYFKLDYKLYI